jgi:hypothetical protein
MHPFLLCFIRAIAWASRANYLLFYLIFFLGLLEPIIDYPIYRAIAWALPANIYYYVSALSLSGPSRQLSFILLLT